MLSYIILSAVLALGSAQRNAAPEVQYPRYPTVEVCPENYGLQVYPHPDSCHSFFKCTNGTLTYETCENGLLFDGRGTNVYNHCNYHWAADCEGRAAELLPVNNGPCEFAFGLFSAGACETDYIKCEYAEPNYLPCQEGLAYDDRIHGCNWPDQLEYCNAEQVVGFQCPTHLDSRDPAAKFLPFPRFATGACDSYFVCVEGLPRKVYCGDFLAFNPETLACEDPEYVPGC